MVNIRYQISKTLSFTLPAAVQTPPVAVVSSGLAPVQSPCIGICELAPNGLCTGCFRTGSEIGAWLSYSDAERSMLMEQILPAREAKQPL